MNPTLTTPGTVYLLHYQEEIGNLDNPLGRARHYIGFATNLEKRLRQHRRGKSGAGIVRAFHANGIKFKLARKWIGADRNFEKYLKLSYKKTTRFCPLCSKHPTNPVLPEGWTGPVWQPAQFDFEMD